MRIHRLLVNTFLAALVIAPLSSCEKDEQEAAKFPRSDADKFRREFSEMVSFTLANGITVFMQEEYTNNQVALEVFYRAGFAYEPAGQAQVSHLVEHCVVFAPTASYGAGEATESLRSGSMVSAEAVGDFVHFDYVAQSERFEEVLKIESERFASAQMTDDVRKEQAKKAAKEIPSVLNSDRGSLKKFGMITMLQAVQHGQEFVPIEAANFERTAEELKSFHDQYYRTDDMILAIVGAIKIDEARPLVEKYFGALPRSPQPPRHEANISSDMNVRWDIDAKVVFLVYPGPFEDERERVALVMFGSYLNQYIARAPNIPVLTRATYTTNPSYPLSNLPFFVFAQPDEYRSTTEVRDAVIKLTDEAISTLDEKLFSRIKNSMTRFIEASFLAAQADNIRVDHHVVIGQHAVNTGIKHYLKAGRSDEEYLAIVDSITLEEMQQIAAKYLSEDQRRVVTITGP
jgi:predicted Zn-dependent peptidase